MIVCRMLITRRLKCHSSPDSDIRETLNFYVGNKIVFTRVYVTHLLSLCLCLVEHSKVAGTKKKHTSELENVFCLAISRKHVMLLYTGFSNNIYVLSIFSSCLDLRPSTQGGRDAAVNFFRVPNRSD